MSQKFIVGIDEVGRGPVAGPVSVGVVVAPVSFDVRHAFAATGLTDSKRMSPSARERVHELARELRESSTIAFGVYSVSAARIDQWGITRAIDTALAEGLAALIPEHLGVEVLLDGRLRAPRQYAQRSIIGGDLSVPIISLAAVVAKVERDALMSGPIDTKYPHYGFSSHKGYGTEAHLSAIQTHGLTPIHRKTFLTNVIGFAHGRSTKQPGLRPTRRSAGSTADAADSTRT
ncbi:MAG: ribonuclease HII [Candidatus Pacebacteria bacterium]|nr:ribonuclease HII [Candidatus Paceibacterota bacterium]